MNNVLLLTGAGFSSPFLRYGEYTLDTAFLTRLFTEVDLNLALFTKLYPNEPFPDHFKEIVEHGAELHHVLAAERPNAPRNFEILFNLIAEEVRYREQLDDGRGALYQLRGHARSYGTNDLYWFQEYVLDVVAQFRARAKDLELVTSFIKHLMTGKRLRHYTLNYDDLFLRAVDAIDEECGSFLSERDLNLGCLYNYPGSPIHGEFMFDEEFKGIRRKHCHFHLHGSAAYSAFPPTISVERRQRPYLSPSSRSFQRGILEMVRRTSTLGSDFRPMNTVERSFITGVNKADQIMTYPFSLMYQSLIHDYRECDELIVIGYSFGDPHINAALSFKNLKFKKVTVVGHWPETDDADKLKRRLKTFHDLLSFRTNYFGMDTQQIEAQEWNMEAPTSRLHQTEGPRDGIDDADTVAWEYDHNGTRSYLQRILKTQGA